MRAVETIINVLDYGAKPNTEVDHTPIINGLLQSIKGTDKDVIVTFPKGTYHFYPDLAPKRAFHISNTDSRRHPVKTVTFLIEQLENVTIDGNGSMFIFHGDVMGIGIFHSKNIRIENLSWDYGVSTCSELTAIQVGKENGLDYADYKIADDMPYEVSADGREFFWLSEKSPYTGEYYWKEKNAKNDMIMVSFDDSTGIKQRVLVEESVFASNLVKITPLDAGKVRMYYENGLPKGVVKNRIFECCKVIDRNTAGAMIWESERVEISNVNVHYLHGFGFLTQMSGDITFDSCRFVPNEILKRTCSSFADSIHVSGAKGKVTIKNSEFTHAHDDPINIHGTFTRIEKILSERQIEVIYAHRQQSGFVQYHVGDEVTFYNRRTMDEIYDLDYRVVNVIHPGEGENDLQTMQVTLDRPLPFDIIKDDNNESIYVMENITYTPEVEIINNRFAHIPTRGILCTTRRPVLIENNHFESMTMSSIFISNDSNEWYESGPVRQMVIRKNTFHITPVLDWHARKPAIHIEPIPLGGKTSQASIHKNILIEENTFHMSHESVIIAENVEKLTFQNNKIISNRKSDNRHDQVNFEFDTCKSVVIKGNTYVDQEVSCVKIKGMDQCEVTITNDLTEMFGD